MENTDKGHTKYQNGCWWPRIYPPNLSTQVQKFWISMKKASSGVRSHWSELRQRLSYQTLLLCRSAFLSGRLSVQKGTRYLGLKILDLQYGQFRVLTFIRKWWELGGTLNICNLYFWMMERLAVLSTFY